MVERFVLPWQSMVDQPISMIHGLADVVVMMTSAVVVPLLEAGGDHVRVLQEDLEADHDLHVITEDHHLDLRDELLLLQGEVFPRVVRDLDRDH